MNRIKAWLPLDHIPLTCFECGGLKNISNDHVPRYMCISKAIIFAYEDYDWMSRQRPDWCPLIVEGKSDGSGGDVQAKRKAHS